MNMDEPSDLHPSPLASDRHSASAGSVEPCQGLVINVPGFFADEDFVRWLENDAPKFTWHRKGAVAEWSDIVVLVDPALDGEGSDSDMPAVFWQEIVNACRQHLGASREVTAHYMVRLTNLSE